MEGTSGPMTLLLLSLPCRVLRVLWTKDLRGRVC
ncbi:hypothetical protein GLYMA_09G081150v4 [Glycine max]|nr:hypothetical protein GLYMA_09G081150v4 [Glycine max]KAH1042069.1 hypothetical protein GYH30_024404 [Glycine max]